MRDAWYPLLLSEELSAERVQATKLFGDPVVLFRGKDGAPACFLDSCPHRSIPFSLGRVVQGRLECGYHGWQYAGDGRCTHVPGLADSKDIPRSAVARTYPTRELHGLVWVWPGDPARAEAEPLPVPFPDCAGHTQTHTISTFFESRYDLVVDHGLDMPHFFQAHTRTLVRYSPRLRHGLPTLAGIDEDERSLSMRWRLQRSSGEVFLTMQAFHPCNIFTNLPLDEQGTRNLQHVVLFTPLDDKRTRGFALIFRNFLTQPVIGTAIDRLYGWIMATARTEDDAIFHGQLANEAMGARSTTSWPYDVVTARYHKWQRARSSEDMWFRDLEHARRRYLREGAA